MFCEIVYIKTYLRDLASDTHGSLSSALDELMQHAAYFLVFFNSVICLTVSSSNLVNIEQTRGEKER